MLRPLSLVLAAFLAVPASGLSGTIHVPADYPTVLAGLDAAVSGDTVLVAPGTWTDTDTRIVQVGKYSLSDDFVRVSERGSGPDQ